MRSKQRSVKCRVLFGASDLLFYGVNDDGGRPDFIPDADFESDQVFSKLANGWISGPSGHLYSLE